jgi:hypothetical protein
MMSSGSYWAFREAAELPDYERDEPDFISLWDNVHVARKPHLCTVCGEEIAPGTRYRSLGFIMDGRFETQKVHGDPGYPSTCPKWAERDRKELEAQFEADRQQFFPAEGGADDGGAGVPVHERSARDELLSPPPGEEGGRGSYSTDIAACAYGDTATAASCQSEGGAE